MQANQKHAELKIMCKRELQSYFRYKNQIVALNMLENQEIYTCRIYIAGY